MPILVWSVCRDVVQSWVQLSAHGRCGPALFHLGEVRGCWADPERMQHGSQGLCLCSPPELVASGCPSLWTEVVFESCSGQDAGGGGNWSNHLLQIISSCKFWLLWKKHNGLPSSQALFFVLYSWASLEDKARVHLGSGCLPSAHLLCAPLAWVVDPAEGTGPWHHS